MSSSTVVSVASLMALCQVAPFDLLVEHLGQLTCHQVVAAGAHEHHVHGIVLEVVLDLLELFAAGAEDVARLVAVVFQPKQREVAHHLDVVGDVGVQRVAEPRITFREHHQPLRMLLDAGGEHRLFRTHVGDPLTGFGI